MKLPRRHFLQLTAGAAALPAASRIASAQTYPRPVRIIVGLRLTFRQNMKLDSPGPAAIGVQTVFVAGGGSRIQRFWAPGFSTAEAMPRRASTGSVRCSISAACATSAAVASCGASFFPSFSTA